MCRSVRVIVLREIRDRERRVALTPAGAENLAGSGHAVVAEVGCGEGAGFSDDDYRRAGAEVVDRWAAVAVDGVIVCVDVVRDGVGPDHVLIGQVDPLWRVADTVELAAAGPTVLSLDLIPRITRAQSMDVLSSMATVAGYEAVLLGASTLPKMFPLLMTAAGTVPAGRTLVLGAGVAGLQAIATARRLGSVVDAYDVRPAAAEQIRSVGGRSIALSLDTSQSEDEGGYATAQADDQTRQQRELLTPYLSDADVVITTASIPGARSPELITTDMVERMRPGSVIVDLAAERGGNCTLTRADEVVVHRGVTVLGPTDLPSRAPRTASRMFSNNVVALLTHLTGDDGELRLDTDDEITAGTLVAAGGTIVHPAVADAAARLDP